jgi:hypothetical protein
MNDESARLKLLKFLLLGEVVSTKLHLEGAA